MRPATFAAILRADNRERFEMVATMYETDGLKIVGVCDGPEEHGKCPHAAWEGLVPCAGLEIAFTKDEWGEVEVRGLERHHFKLPEDLRVCPLTGQGMLALVSGAEEGYFSPFAPDGL
jgi:hypothetical protein